MICSNEDCKSEFQEKDFDDIDCEYDEDTQLCPSCQDHKEISSQTCEICDDKTATEYAGGLFYCEDCYEDNYN